LVVLAEDAVEVAVREEEVDDAGVWASGAGERGLLAEVDGDGRHHGVCRGAAESAGGATVDAAAARAEVAGVRCQSQLHTE